MNDRYAETEHDFSINVDDAILPGRLTVPTNAEAIIIFADTNGYSSGKSLQLAEIFQNKHYGTLQMDMLMEGEEDAPDLYPILAERLEAAINWLDNDADTRLCDYVLFSRTPAGANSALAAMKDKTTKIAATVLHVDLVDPSELPEIAGPTLVLTGTTPDVDIENLTLAKPDNVVQQVIDWYLKVRDMSKDSPE